MFYRMQNGARAPVSCEIMNHLKMKHESTLLFRFACALRRLARLGQAIWLNTPTLHVLRKSARDHGVCLQVFECLDCVGTLAPHNHILVARDYSIQVHKVV